MEIGERIVTELVDWCLYDQTELLPSDEWPSRNLFVLPVGQREEYNRATDEWHYKSFIKTNQLMPGMLPAPQTFEIHRLNVLLMDEDRILRLYESRLYSQMTAELSIGCKIYWNGPLWQCASPFAIFDSPKFAIAELADRNVDWKEVGASFNPPHRIREMEFFSVVIRHQQLVEPITVACHLDGKLTLPLV